MKAICGFLAAGLAAFAAVTVMSTVALAGASHSSARYGPPAASAPASHSAKASAVAAPESPTNCPAGDFCSYNVVEGSSPCVEQFEGNDNWSSSCANRDESIYNGTADKVRVYFSARGWRANASAWMCIDSTDYINNLLTGDGNPGNNQGAYPFDQGKGLPGFEQDVNKNAHSSSVAQGSCNPNE